MASPISARARDYVRSRATAVMAYKATVERITTGSHDEDTLVYTPGSRTTVIEEVMVRIWEIQGASVVGIGESDLMMQNLQISLPWDSPILKKNDEILITEAPTQDTSMLNKRFQVISSARAGELRATRRYQVKAVER